MATRQAREATRRISKKQRMWQAAVLLAVMTAGTIAWSLPQAQTAHALPSVTILTVGDSISSEGRWQARLSEMLASAGAPNTIVNKAVAGITCVETNTILTNAVLQQVNPDLVIIACGTNDNPNAIKYGEPETGWALRSMIERVHAWKATAKVMPALIQYSDPMLVSDTKISNEGRINDILYRNMLYYPVGPWLAGIADLQYIPSTATYLRDTEPYPEARGIHPTERGYYYMARIMYDSGRSVMGWPVLTDVVNPNTGENWSQLCDLYGHRKGFQRPAVNPDPSIYDANRPCVMPE